LHVITRREFSTFLAGMLNQPTLAAEGNAGAIIEGPIVGCTGKNSAFGMNPNNPAGTLKVTGSSEVYEVHGDLYSADVLHLTGGAAKAIRIDGDLFYVDSLDMQIDLWVGPPSQAGIDIDTDCSDATTYGGDPNDWTFHHSSTIPGAQIQAHACVYNAGGNYQLPQPLASTLDPPLVYDYDDFDITQGGQYAEDAAGCTVGSCTETPNYDINGVTTWTRYGNDYYYYTGGSAWNPSGTLPTGIFFLPAGGLHSTGGGATWNEYTTIVTDSGIEFTGSAALDPGTADTWKPYDGTNGSGALFVSTGTGNAIQLSGASLPDSEGMMYAPNGDCQISGSANYNGAMICYNVDSSGSTGSIKFDFTYCPPPLPVIQFKS
jgi:hypothetical protein